MQDWFATCHNEFNEKTHHLIFKNMLDSGYFSLRLFFKLAAVSFCQNEQRGEEAVILI